MSSVRTTFFKLFCVFLYYQQVEYVQTKFFVRTQLSVRLIMSADSKVWFSAGELSLLGEQLVAGLPTTMRGCTRMAKNVGWVSREVKGKGGPGGIRTEYQPPANVLVLIQSYLAANPEFFAKSKTRTKADLANLSKEVFGDAPARLRAAVPIDPQLAALLDPQPDDRLRMLLMVLRASENQLKDPPTPEVAQKIITLVDAWLPFASNVPVLKERLEALKATAMLFV